MSPITGYVSGCLGSVQPFVFDPATIAWVNAVIANGGTVSLGRETVVNNLIVGLKADGLFSKLDRLWLLAAENTPSALTDIVADQLATAVNSPTFTTDRGYTGNGSTSYVDSNYNPATNGVNYTLNTNHLGCWVVVVDQTNLVAACGASDGTQQISILWINTPGWEAGNNTGSTGTGTNGGAGHVVNSRTASNSFTISLNGTIGNTFGAAPTAIPSINVFIGARGPGSSFSSNQMASMHIGGPLSSTDLTNFYNRMRTYMTAVGVP